ncbi:hypothetical protein PUN28_010281 [Cardiocondyla obscurior]|uniref:Uncharacterized protein n=1 Tax=Cardiocondyla obscurior TaxID=286306 RepID=A0AAW2FQD0_9HYME
MSRLTGLGIVVRSLPQRPDTANPRDSWWYFHRQTEVGKREKEEKKKEREDTCACTRVCLCAEACVSDLSRPSHISRSVAFAPSHFPSRAVNDLVGRCSRCSKVVRYMRARSRFHRIYATSL